jgi:hypothetical protein
MAINLLIYSILFFIQNNGVNHDLNSIFIEKNSKVSTHITKYGIRTEIKQDFGIKNSHLFYKKKIIEFSWYPIFISCDSYICVSKEQFKTI